MLTWIFGHPLPFACTTNLAETLAPHRAAIPVLGDLLAHERRPGRRDLPLDLGPRTAARPRPPPPLTPGDCALASHKAVVPGVTDARELLGLLQDEVAAKPGGGLGRLGF